MLWTFFQQVVLGTPGQDVLMDIIVTIGFIVFGLGLQWFIFFLKLHTEVRNDDIYLKFPPLHVGWVRIGREDIDA